MKKLIQKSLRRISGLTKRAARSLDSPEKQAHREQVNEYYRLDRQRRFRTDYPKLNADSIVLDLGGFAGQWASDIYSRYRCTVHVFEPLPQYAENIQQRFRQNTDVKVYPFGLGSKDEAIELSVAGDATSAFAGQGEMVKAKIKNYHDFLLENNIERINLIKINIEGAEFDLLEYLIEQNLLTTVENFQIQFHRFAPDAENRMKKIQRALSKTHELTYHYPFFWENWQISISSKV